MKEYTIEEYHDVRDEMVFDDDFEDAKNYWFRLNNLRYQLFKVKLAKLMCEIDTRAADALIDALKLRMQLARG